MVYLYKVINQLFTLLKRQSEPYPNIGVGLALGLVTPFICTFLLTYVRTVYGINGQNKNSMYVLFSYLRTVRTSSIFKAAQNGKPTPILAYV